MYGHYRLEIIYRNREAYIQVWYAYRTASQRTGEPYTGMVVCKEGVIKHGNHSGVVYNYIHKEVEQGNLCKR